MSHIADIRHLIAKAQMQEAEDSCNTLLEAEDSAEGYELLGYIAQQTGRQSLSSACCSRHNHDVLDN